MKAFKSLLSAILVFILIGQASAQDYTVRVDPANPKRKIIDIKPAVKRMDQIIQLKNVLDAGPKRPPLEFKPFPMRNPKTGKDLNPDAKMTIKFNDTLTKTVTVREFFDQLNAMEQSACNRGRSLRIPATFADLKPEFNIAPYYKNGKLPGGYKTLTFKTQSNPSPFNVRGGIRNASFTNSNVTVGSNTFTVQPWSPQLFISSTIENQGTQEFPVKWVTQTQTNPGRKIFPVIVEVPKGFSQLVKKIEWQVREQPFDQTLEDIKVPGLVGSGIISNPVFDHNVQGLDIIPDNNNNNYHYFTIDISSLPGMAAPTDKARLFFIRTIEYSPTNEVLKISPQVAAVYGGIPEQLVAFPEVNSVPTFNYRYPTDESVPFGLYLRGEGFDTYKHRYWASKTAKTMSTDGFRFKTSASLGIRYFNFLSIVSADQPKTKELNIITARFTAGAGVGIAQEDLGVKLSLDILEGFRKPEIDFKAMSPGATSINIDQTVNEDFDWDVMNNRFMIGPIPFRITAKVGGNAGVALSGNVDLQNLNFNGTITPYLHTWFSASGGVDAVIAYAMLTAKIDPLLGIDMPVGFSSTGKSLTFSNKITALNGRVFLSVGFFYPCPSLEKVIGFLTGDDPLPLCECKWEWNIFDWKGYEETFKY